MLIWEYVNFKKFMEMIEFVVLWFMGVVLLLMVVGLIWGFFFILYVINFGVMVKIFYLYVLSVLMVINVWGMMVVVLIIWLVCCYYVFVLVVKVVVLVGMVMILIGLIIGVIWG